MLAGDSLNLTVHAGGCGFTYHDGTAAWSFNLSSVGHAELRARGLQFDYLLMPCGTATEACRPSVCSENNASACQPYDSDAPQRGAAVQYGVHSATPDAPRLPQQNCFEQGTSPPVEAPCTKTCNVLAPAVPSHNATVLTPHSSSWSLTEWSPHQYNSARPRLSYAPQQPAWFLRPDPANWSFPRRVACTDPQGHSTRTLHIEFACDPDAAEPELSEPPSDADCEVELTVRSADACFAFEWRAGEWGGCDFVHLVRHRRVQCVEVSGRSTASTDDLCASHRPASATGCTAPAPPPPARAALRGGGISLIVLGSLALIAALGVGIFRLMTQHRLVEQRRRLLAMTESYQALATVQEQPHAQGGYYGAGGDSER